MICNYSASVSLLGAELSGKRRCRGEAPSSLPAQCKAGVHRPGWDLGIWALQHQEIVFRVARTELWRLLRMLWHSSVEGYLVGFAPASGLKRLGQCIAGGGAGLGTRGCDVPSPAAGWGQRENMQLGLTQPCSSLLPREGFCFAKQPSLQKSRADRSHPLVPGPGTGGIRSPVALAAVSGVTVQHRPVRDPTPARACL